MSDRTGTGPEQPDPAFERLAAADPARNVTPDLGRLEATVRDRIGERDVMSYDDVARRRGWRSTNRLAWVAAAAAVGVALAGGGFALGRGAQPPAPAGGVISASGSGSGGEDSARGAPEPARPDDARSAHMPYFGGRTVFSGSGLSGSSGSAKAWGFDAQKTFSEETAVRLAKALNVPGDAQLVDGAWVVGSQDGTGRSLRLEPDGLGTFSFYDPGLDPHACAELAKELRSGAVETGEPAPQQADCPSKAPDVGPAPDEKTAIAQAEKLLDSLGVDPDSFEYELMEPGGETPYAHLTAFAVVDGQRSGLAWNFSWVGEKVQSVSGVIAPLVSLGSYEVVSADEAVARLADPRFGATGSYGIMGADPRARGAEDSVSSGGDVATMPRRTVPPTPGSGAKISWPVENVTITKARLGVAGHVQPSGATLLLPTYELSAGDGRAWSVLAIADKHLDFAANR